ncbi:hypothetical protein [Pantoea cypripedii]|uniref:Uncharacterized protein n=1 Tax=Pantoea cypripedii TaxID=55209 RepID=A0A1X1EFH7_PANCY|nr:hypothetical protein [Pantoea cypripedii]MBP2199461.1 hypothetical protein [Pantoea cypripedii]ORM87707.1 hypothetical protein HA50_27555 [Pantoea cypripedii]
MISSVNNTSNLSPITTTDLASPPTPASEQYSPPCDKSALQTLNSSIRFASENTLDWSDNSFISGTFASLCTYEVGHWLQAETGLSYRPPVHQEEGGLVPLSSLLYGQEETLTEKELKTLADALLKLEKNCLPMEEEPETAVPEMEKWKEGLEKLKEFRRLGKNREYLTVDMPRLQEKTVDLAEREWMPDTRHAGASLQLLCQELSSYKPKNDVPTGDQNVGMKNAVHSLCKLAEALEKADTLLAGVVEFRMTGNALALPVGPEAILRDLQRAREETRFEHLWKAVAETTDKASWPEQDPLHKRLNDTFSALESGCRITEQAISNARPLYLREMRTEQVWLQKEAEAVMKECRGSGLPLVRDAAAALETMCHLTAQAMSVAGESKEEVIMALRKSAGDLCNLSAALQNAVTIGPVVHGGKAGGKEARVLAEKALNSVMNDVKKALEKLKKHQKPLAKVQFSGLEKTAMHDALKQLKSRVGLLAGNMNTLRNEMKDPLPDDVLEFLLRALDHSRAARWLGKQDDKTADVLSALGHLTGKGVRSVQNVYAHYKQGAKRSEFNVLMRGAARGPLGMMLRVCRATEKLAFAAMEAAEKKPDVTRLHADRNRKIREDKPAERVAQHRKEKMVALEKAQKTAEGEMEKLALVHGRLNRDLDGMLSAFAAPEEHKEIERLRRRCDRSVDRCQEEARKIRRAMDRLVSPAGKGGSQQLSAALRDKETYEEARRAITEGLAGMRTAMGEFEVEVALITGKCFDLFSWDSKIVRFSAEVVDMCGAMLLPENPTAEDHEESERVMRGMALEMGRLLVKPQDPEGHDFAGRVLQEVGMRRADTAVKAQTPEEVMKFVHSWEQQKMDKSAGKTVSAFVSRAGKMLARQALPELFGAAVHIAKIAKAFYKAATTLATYFETRKQLNNAVQVDGHVLAVDKDAVRDRMVKSLVEIWLKLIVPSGVQLAAQTVVTGVAIKRDGWSAVKDKAIKSMKEDLVITTVAEGIALGATRIIGDVVKQTPDNAQVTHSNLNKMKTNTALLWDTRTTTVHSRSGAQGAAPEPEVKSRGKRSTQPDKEQATSDASAIQPPITGAPEAAENDTLVGAAQKTSVGSTDASEFTVTEKEYNDTQIGIDARMKADYRKFIENHIQKILDKHPKGRGKISSPYSYVSTIIKGPPDVVGRARIIDIYTGNVPFNAEVLWHGSTGDKDSTETYPEFRRELFGQKGFKSVRNDPHGVMPITDEQRRLDVRNNPHIKHSAAKLRETWPNHLRDMRTRAPEMATLYRNIFKLGFKNALTSPEAQLSEGEKTAIREFLNGNNTHVTTLKYNGKPVLDVIALEVPGDNPNEKKLLLMDYDGKLLRTSAGTVNNGNSFTPDAALQTYIAQHMTQGTSEDAAKVPTRTVTIENTGDNYDTKLVENYFTAQNNEFYRVVADPNKEDKSRLFKKLDKIADNLTFIIGMSGAPKTTPQGMLASAVVTMGKGIIKYTIESDATERKNITIQTGIDVTSGLITDGLGGRLLGKLGKKSKFVSDGMKFSNDTGITTQKAGEKINEETTKLAKKLGVEVKSNQSDALSAPKEEQALATENHLSATPENGSGGLTPSTLWQQVLSNIRKGLLHDNKTNTLSTETIRFLESVGVDIKKLLDRYGSEESRRRANVNGVTDYSRVEFDSNGVNDILNEAQEAYKKFEKAQLQERIIDKLKELERITANGGKIQIPYQLLKDLRQAGIDIDYYLSGNALDDDNNPDTKYEVRYEHSRLDQWRLKKLRFMVKAEQLDESNMESAVDLLREIRDEAGENEKVTVPEKVVRMLKTPTSNARIYILTNGDEKPAKEAAQQVGHSNPTNHRYVSDYTLDKGHLNSLIEKYRGHSIPNQQAAHTYLTKRIDDMAAEDNGVGDDVQIYSFPANFENAVKKEGRFDLKTYMEDHGKYSMAKGCWLISKNQMSDLAKELYVTLPAEERAKIDARSTVAQLTANHQALERKWTNVGQELDALIASGGEGNLTPETINFLRAQGVDINGSLKRNGTTLSVTPAEDGNISYEEIKVGSRGASAIKEDIEQFKRRQKIPATLKQIHSLMERLDKHKRLQLPESVRKILQASPAIDTNDLYMEEIKTRTVSRAELNWMYWALKAEAELPANSTPEQTAAFMQELENAMGTGDTIALPPHLINRLNAHGVEVDDFVKEHGNTTLAEEYAEKRGTPDNLDSRDIEISKERITELRGKLPVSQAPLAPSTDEQPENDTPVTAGT